MPEKEFDRICSVTSADGLTVEYGIIEGNSQIVFIKVGAGSNYLGTEEKHLKMARLLNEKLGCTVICASNPDSDSFRKCDFRLLSEYIENCITDEPELYFIGSSNGAYQGLVFATRAFHFKKILLINMPLMLNYHKIKAALDVLSDTKVTFVYGEYDPSYNYLPFLQNRYESKFKILISNRADHTFSNMTDEYAALGNLIIDR